MMKLRQTVIAVSLAFPLLASAQSTTQMQSEIDALKAQVKELQDLVKSHTMTAAPAAAPDAEPTVSLEEFNRIKTKVEAADDVKETNGMNKLRISAGINPVYIYDQNKNASGFSFANNPNTFAYDDSVFGIAYLDVQKEMEGGTKFHLTLMPTKSSTSSAAGTPTSIIQEASASIPFAGNDNRLLVGQIPDVSGYEPTYPTYVGENNISTNLLYPSYPTYFITHNLLFDFTGASYYTGVGLDLLRDSGYWEFKLFAANVNNSRNDSKLSAGANQANQNEGFIYNAAYTENEFWGFEFTGYYIPGMATPTGGEGTVNQFEIDGNFTRGDFNGNLQFVTGSQQNGAYTADANGNPQSSYWSGLSLLLSERLSPKWSVAGRYDYIYNQQNGGGIFTLGTYNAGGSNTGDAINGFGPDVADPTTGTNRQALSLAASYRLNQNTTLRGEFRRDFASTNAFYDFNSGNPTSTNNLFALSAMVNF